MGSACKSSGANLASSILEDLLNLMYQKYADNDEVEDTFCSSVSGGRPSHCESMVGNNMLWPTMRDPVYFGLFLLQPMVVEQEVL